MDLHEDIHRAVENYLDENEFRRYLNSAIQTSRGVSFLIQKRKAGWSDFDNWYGRWQSDARSNAVLTWGVNSRNRIVKEEDLRTLSQAVITYYGPRLQEAEDVLTVPPDTTVDEVLGLFAESIHSQPSGREGWIRIQRRWVDDRLPDYELVAALREMYAGLAKLVKLAHHASGITTCNAPRFRRACVNSDIDGALPCLGRGNPLPAGMIDAKTGALLNYEYIVFGRDDAAIERGKQRYGLTPQMGVDVIQHAEFRMQLSKRFLEADGNSAQVLLLFKGMQEVRVNGVVFGKQEPREFKIAAAVEGHGAWPFDGAVFASETWITQYKGNHRRGAFSGIPEEDLVSPPEDMFDADPVGGREEALIVEALAADGRSRVLLQPFARTRSGIVYGPLIEDTTGRMVTPFLRPVWRRWAAWKQGVPTSDPEQTTHTSTEA